MMKLRDALVVAGVAVVSGGAFSLVASPFHVDADGEEIVIELPKPAMTVDGVELTVVDEPAKDGKRTLKILAKNETDKPVKIKTTVSAMSERGEPMGRMAYIPEMLWTEEILVSVAPHSETEVVVKKAAKADAVYSYVTVAAGDQAVSTSTFASLLNFDARSLNAGNVNVPVNVDLQSIELAATN